MCVEQVRFIITDMVRYFKVCMECPYNLTKLELIEVLMTNNIHTSMQESDPLSSWFDLAYSSGIEPFLSDKGFCIVYDFPLCQSMLAEVDQSHKPFAKRFELIVNGIECGNGFQELRSALMRLRERFKKII